MRRISLMLFVIAGLLIAACAAPAAPAAEATEAPAEAASAEGSMTELPAVNPLEVTGDIITAGSSTVFPLSEAMAARFVDEGYAGNITIDSIGTGGGFERFCVAAETDIANASRPINEEEAAACTAAGREAIQFRVGTDALAIVVNPDNEFMTDVTIEQLAKIFASEAATWADVDPSWPAEPIARFSPGTDSGTFDYFVESVMDKVYTGEGEGEQQILGAAGIQLSEDDNVLVQGVEGDLNAIGYFGFAYYLENADRLKLVSVNGVTPDETTAEDGSYPLARPLFIYSAAPIIAEKPQVGAFINFYLTYVNEEISAVGYFPASEAALNESKAALLAAMGQ
jgi:phosphate transport system substrate-binding protein